MGTILDTSVILENPKELLNYDDIVMLNCILRELDEKKYNKRIGYKAREAIRIIIDKNFSYKMFENSDNSADDIILRNISDHRVITADGSFYLRGKSKGLDIEFYESVEKEIYNGISNQYLGQDTIDRLNNKKKIKTNLNLYENQFLDLGNTIARYKDGYLHKVSWNKRVNGIEKPNKRQLMALDVLFDNDVKLVSLYGKAGTGKTSITINAAIEQAMSGGYNKILISRPKKQRGLSEEKLGYLTGDMESKMSPFIAPFEDNLYTQTAIKPEIIPLSMIQGRSFDNAIWIITEAQDIRKEDMDLIVGRCGQGTKLIVEGDRFQNSDRNLDEFNNGLTHVINTLKDEKLTATVELDEVERSELARMANRLKCEG